MIPRRRFLRQAALLGGATMIFPFGCKDSVPDDVRIERVVQIEFRGKRPKYVGKNSRIGEHTEFGRDKAILLFTSDGNVGIGTYWGDKASMQAFLGKSLLTFFQETEKAFVIGEGNRGTMAFWDVLGKYHKKPLWQLLGEQKRELVPLYDGTIYFQDLLPQFADNYMDQFKKEFDMGIVAGHNFFKMKVGRGGKWMEKEAGYQRDIEVLAACREYLGPNIKIGVDANNGMDLPSTKQMLTDLPNFDFEFMEEMFPEEVTLDTELKTFIKDGGWDTLVADFESQKEVEAFLPFLEAGCIDVMQGDMNRFGIEGIIAEAAIGAKYGARVAPHNWGSMLGYYCQLHLGKVIDNWYCAEQDALSLASIRPVGFEVKDGFTTVSDAPGLGLEIDVDALLKESEVLVDLKA